MQHAARERIAQLDATAERLDVPFTGGTIRWRRFGTGRPLVLVHGGYGSWMHWVRNVAALLRSAELWIPDLPGYGDSSSLPRDAGVKRVVETIVAAIDRWWVRGTPVDFAGFSFGGVVSARTAVARGHVRRLALLGTGGHGGPRRPRASSGNGAGWSPRRRARPCATTSLRSCSTIRSRSIRSALEAYARSCAATRYRSRPVSRAASIGELLEPFTNPVLLLFGEHDVTTTPEVVAKTLVEGHPNRESLVIPGGGHWVQYERADAVNRVLVDWLRE